MAKDLQIPQGALSQLINGLSASSKTGDVGKKISNLIGVLRTSQTNFIPSEPEEDCPVTSIYSAGELSRSVSLDLCYAVKRLIRGLASSDSNVRISYGISLAALLENFRDILPIEVIWKWSLALLSGHVIFGNASLSRGEQSTLFSAKLTCIGSIVEGYSGSSSLCNQTTNNEMVVELISIAKSRTFLRDSAFQILLSIIKFQTDQLQFMTSIIPLIDQIPLSADFIKFINDLEISNPALLLQISPKLENFPVFKNEMIVFEALLETISTSTTPHPLWIIFVSFLKANEIFQKFYTEKMEDGLFGSESVEKKLIGLLIFDHLWSDSSDSCTKSKKLLDLFNNVAPNIGSKAKGNLPLTMAVEKSVQFRA